MSARIFELLIGWFTGELSNEEFLEALRPAIAAWRGEHYTKQQEPC